jgi:thiamine biosynthesis lipoprotein ApbE
MGEERAMQYLEELDGYEAFLITADGRNVSTKGMGFEAQ